MSSAEAEIPVPPDAPDSLESLRQAFARLRPPKGDRFEPLSLTVAVSREAGSRGGTIARRAGRKLGWQVYDQELLEYLAQERQLAGGLFDVLDDKALAWVDEHLQQLLREQSLSQNRSIVELARVILAIGCRGEAVILGRGAGCILPPSSALHVRIVAPLADRIVYMSQLERLTPEQAAEQVIVRGRRRAEFVETHFHRNPADIYQYDLLINSSKLGEELSAELIVQAALAKLAARGREEGTPLPTAPESVS